MKKILLAVLLTFSMSSFAATSEQMDKYVQNKSVVLQILGATAYYEDNCQGLTPVGDYYRSVAILLHDIDEETLTNHKLFISGYSMASYFGNCENIAEQFKGLGIGDFLEKK
jgi:hypothetical protein